MTHDARHEALLEALALGQEDPDSERARAQLDLCPACRGIWERMQALGSALDEFGRERARVLAEQHELLAAPGATEAERALRAEIRRSRRPAWRAWVLAIAALALFGLGLKLLWLDRAEPHAPDGLMGNPAWGATSPARRVEQFFPIRWERLLRPDQELVLRLETRAEDEERWTELYAGPVRGQSWTPEESIQKACKDRIRYRLDVRDGAGEGDSSLWREAWR